LLQKIRNGQHGFTLIEVIVAIAVVAILAGIITPSVIKHLDDSKRARAQNDCLVIGSSIASFMKDTGRLPNANNAGNPTLTMLIGQGAVPTLGGGIVTWNQTTATGTVDLFTNHLTDNSPRSQVAWQYPTPATAPGVELVWRGPYLPSIPADPWGNRYAVNIGNIGAAYPVVWVLSAGPDGRIDTPFSPAAPAVGTTLTANGDDIIYRIR
jgi:prepilin-type N-terminal cleavage/methylation domain-containing protein